MRATFAKLTELGGMAVGGIFMNQKEEFQILPESKLRKNERKENFPMFVDWSFLNMSHKSITSYIALFFFFPRSLTSEYWPLNMGSFVWDIPEAKVGALNPCPACLSVNMRYLQPAWVWTQAETGTLALCWQRRCTARLKVNGWQMAACFWDGR